MSKEPSQREGRLSAKPLWSGNLIRIIRQTRPALHLVPSIESPMRRGSGGPTTVSVSVWWHHKNEPIAAISNCNRENDHLQLTGDKRNASMY